MGKKSGRGSSKAGGDDEAAKAARAFVLKVPTHCGCDGCADKIRAAVKDLTLRCDGIQSLDQSALGTRGELAVVATADPETLRRRLRKATGKSVDLVFPKPAAATPAAADDTAGAVQAMLLARLQQQQQQAAATAHHGLPWNALHHGGYEQAAYPWVLQQAPPEPYPYSASYPAAEWGAYPHHGLGGAYGGGWLG